MKSKVFLLLVCLCTTKFFGQAVLGVDTILKTGPIGKRINLVIISEGFTAAQMSLFNSKAASLTNYLFSEAPFKRYKQYFNVFAIRIVSPQSGVSHPGTATDVTEPQIPVASVNNLFATTFDNNFTHRAIVSNNSSAVFGVLAANFPAYDQAVVLANSTEYGGTGGAYAVMSINSSAPETLVHELGHSFAGLADEYWAGSIFATEKPNMTADGDNSTVKWAQWVGTNGIDDYAYGTTTPESDWFRPHQNCKMQFLGAPFCGVCQQTVIERIHDLTNPIDDYTPSDAAPLEYVDTTVWLKTKLIKPIPNTLKSTWEVNSIVVARNIDSVGLTQTTLFPGTSNNVVYTVTDSTVLSRDPDHANLHVYSIVWDVTYYSTVGIKEIKPRMEFSIFPNPAADLINLNYTLLKDSEVGISVTDMSGKTVVVAEKSKATVAGEYKKEINISSLPPGAYMITLKINDQTINNKFIVSK